MNLDVTEESIIIDSKLYTVYETSMKIQRLGTVITRVNFIIVRLRVFPFIKQVPVTR